MLMAVDGGNDVDGVSYVDGGSGQHGKKTWLHGYLEAYVPLRIGIRLASTY